MADLFITGNQFADGLALYQAANSDNQSIRRNFVVRKQEFELITEALKNKEANDPLQHELILGRRGSGKSTLLRRIQAEIEENEQLQKKYIAINLAEEQAGIYRLSDLWEAVLKELTDRYNLPSTTVNYNDCKDDSEYTSQLYSAISNALQARQQKAVLLLDNFDRIVGNFSDDGHLLRETLLNHNDMQTIAGSTRMDEHFWQYDQPFYEFFRRHRLEALDTSEIIGLLNHWSQVLQLPQLADFAKNNIGKIESIRIMTDGLPRTLQFFIQILLQNDQLYGYEYLRKIMDGVTTLYQERLNNLPAAQRKIIAEMAFIWEACSTKELVEKCRMESKLISANIKQLSNAGIVETITTNKKNHLYRIAERFFNMWLIITQGNPDQKRKAKWLSIFLEEWYSREELQAVADNHIKNLQEGKLGYGKALVLTKAFSQSRFISIKERDEMLSLTTALLPQGIEAGLLGLPEHGMKIIEQIDVQITKGNFENAHELVAGIENEEDGVKFFVEGLIYFNEGKILQAERSWVKAVEKGESLAMSNLALIYKSQKKFKKAEELLRASATLSNVLAYFHLAVLYYEQNINKEESLRLIHSYCEMNPRDLKGQGFKLIVDVWNGEFRDLKNRFDVLVQNDETAPLLLTHLLFQHQKNLVLDSFTTQIFSNELQKKYAPLYYATLILNKKNSNIGLRVPPEIQPTVDEILDIVAEKQAFYAE